MSRSNVSLQITQQFKGQILRLDGGIMQHATMRYETGSSEIIGWGDREFPACMGEVMVVATALNDPDEQEDFKGIDLMQVCDKNIPLIARLAKKYGFERTSFACYRQPIIESDFATFIKNK